MGSLKKHFHFVGIGGVGMGTIASLLLDKGFQVSGSDIKEGYFTSHLREKGGKVFIGHSEKNLKGNLPDYVIYSSAIDEKNPELLYAKNKKVPFLKRAEILAQLMSTETSITVAGAHGKTTTTSMVSHLLIKAGFHPTTAVGGVIKSGESSAHLGQGKYFVAELDESDGSFLYFSPFYSIITNIDLEHIDYYRNLRNILTAYKNFIGKTNVFGCLFACGDDERLKELLLDCRRKYFTYGFGDGNDICAKNVICDGLSSRFDCIVTSELKGQVILNVPGRHNILNALACIGLGLELSIDFGVIACSLQEYSGVQRRFQVKADVNGILVVDDYGHHPSEVAETIKTAKALGRGRVVVAFQPHRYTRTKFLFDQFIESLSLSDYLLITDIYAASEKPIKGVSAKNIYEKMKAEKKHPVEYVKRQNMTQQLLKTIQKGDVVLTLGAGDIGQVSEEIAEKLKAGS